MHHEIHPGDVIQPLKPGSDIFTFFFQMYNIRLGFEVVAGNLSFKSADSAQNSWVCLKFLRESRLHAMDFY